MTIKQAVVDKYMTAMIDRAVGDEGSVVTAADSAIGVYESVITQLNQVIASYHGLDEAAAAAYGRQS